MYCPNCNHLNDESARFCSKCGEYLERKAPEACPDCGTARKEGDTFCPTCGYRYPQPTAPTMQPAGNTGYAAGSSSTNGYQSAGNFSSHYDSTYNTYQDTNRKYANFGERLVASIVDGLITGVAGFILGFVFAMADGGEILINILSLAIGIAYKAGMESSSKQATLGKMAMGIKVVGPDGGRISIGRGIGRYFANILNMFTIGIGYLMVLWTKEKRALHDFVAGTYVIK